MNLTKSGIKDFEKIYPLALEFNNDLTEGISAEDLDTFENILIKMQNNIKEE